MDIFIRNVPLQSTTDQLKDFLRTSLLQLGVLAFELNKVRNKNFAILSLPDVDKATQFLLLHGARFRSTPMQPLYFGGSALNCTASKNAQDEHLRKSLQLADKKTRERQSQPSKNAALNSKRNLQTVFAFRTLHCGAWSYQNSLLTFDQYYRDERAGTITFGTSSLVVLLHRNPDLPHCRLDVPYYSIEHVLTGNSTTATISLTLRWPPKIYEDTLAGDIYKPNSTTTEDLLASLMKLSISSAKLAPTAPAFIPSQQDRSQGKRIRLSSIAKGHEGTVGSCFVYQVSLSDRRLMEEAVRTIKKRAGIPDHMTFETRVRKPPTTFTQDYSRLSSVLADYTRNISLTYPVRFQLERLALNGILSPSTIQILIPGLASLVAVYKTNQVATALGRLVHEVEFPGPRAETKNFRPDELLKRLRHHTEAAYKEQDESIYKRVEEREHLALVHKVLITPCGLLLTGPDPEVTNRVLRKYAKYHDYFLRVTFGDEDATPVHFDARANQERIYHGRFKQILDKGVNIAGRTFKFLGFSHSSLRSQSCWFMAPFTLDGGLVFSPDVIRGLGNFTTFRSPAKCAARIGQAFSDTLTSVSLPDGAWFETKDVERNGRVFSDGCGTISMKLLRQVWLEYGVGKSLKPTILQIRMAGVKGVVSLDSRLDGYQICTRPSMEKFHEATSHDIELCGGSFSPLPLHLNRQFIKILEDLQVPAKAFLELQEQVVRQLRQVTLHTLNASVFLEWAHIGQAAKTASLLKRMHTIGLEFQQDKFLTDTIEIAVLSRLREIKHRSRIPVENGYTLYGIMDETGYLKKGQVYVATEKMKDGKRQRSVLVRERVVITRAPALHPGDIQLVEAVDVPSNSPLKNIYNCVMFSQWGDRDLPSQLSGGDLDGDLYQVIYEPRLIPKVTKEPADYPRQEPVDIGRPVEPKDMTDFFIKFMETDQLGRISTLHQILADKHTTKDLPGTFHPECIKLAEMASTAVDFSKTGIPVDLSKLPRGDNGVRPDFMATGPRVFVESKGAVLEDAEEDDDEVDPVRALDPDQRKFRYYESDNVLGRLYRAIDEAKFFEQMQKDSRTAKAKDPRNSLMEKLLQHVKRETVGLQYLQYMDLARTLREEYESNLVSIMAQYSTHPAHPLNELEVFSGSILGKSLGAQNKQTREHAKDMVERFNRDVTAAIKVIVQGDEEDEEDDDVKREEALPRALACLENSLREVGSWPRKGLVSWRYVVAAVCLEELERARLRSGLRGPVRLYA
ncbi:RNA-directed RNA polymerase [Mytilinidion resinicola]|uniref:RNA-dependent RNA polymerase n=1 Tax=Mytilinidion resinicola TaxID=574789 RepID=A0A6A6Z227_9PEZI|nr:RNA-directed RNA polymerase [Mytilinidion resinicola]KAF2814287.1 RNA-directed RNA polymerase [Mytilinidion resinicola]